MRQSNKVQVSSMTTCFHNRQPCPFRSTKMKSYAMCKKTLSHLMGRERSYSCKENYPQGVFVKIVDPYEGVE